MPVSDAQKKATAKWQKNNTTMISIRLQHGSDKDLIEYLDGKTKGSTFKTALREYIKNHPDK